MKRSVILMGGKTYVVSLPSSWVKSNNVKKGDLLDVDQQDGAILINTGESSESRCCEVNVSNLDFMLRRTVGAVYKAGYNQVKFVYKGKEQLEVIEDVMKKACIGFEIVDQGEKFVVVRCLSQNIEGEFCHSFKRLFYAIEVMGEEFLEALMLQDKKLLEEVVSRDHQVNRFADFCRRLISNGSFVVDKSFVVYYVVEQLERLGDLYKSMARKAIKQDVFLSEESLVLMKEMKVFFTTFRKLYFSFSLQGIELFAQEFNVLKERLDSADHSLASMSSHFLQVVFDMNGALLVKRL
jgi:phosphate uptake regulator